MDSDSAFTGFLIGLVTGVGLVVFVMLATNNLPGAVENKTRQEAADSGAAEWRINSVTGERSFHWLGTETRQNEEVPE